jgi:hypothetical protein
MRKAPGSNPGASNLVLEKYFVVSFSIENKATQRLVPFISI